MSVSLVKISLELTSTENHSANKKPEKIKEQRKRKFKKKQITDSKKNAAILVQRLREKSRADSQTDKIETNVQKLLNLSKTNLIQNKKLEKKLLHKITQRSEETSVNRSKDKSAFTEEDFAKFESEYFAN